MIKRILVLQMKRIGDLILTIPALQTLRQRFPQAEIEIVVDGPCGDLAQCIPSVNRALVYRSRHLNAATWSNVVAADWDVCLDFTGNDRSALLTRMSGAKWRLGYQKFSKNRARSLAYTQLSAASVRDLHTVDFHLALLDELPHPVKTSAKKTGSVTAEPLRFSAAAEKKVDDLVAQIPAGKAFAVLHPGTARKEKFWPVERWLAVVEALRDLGLMVVMTGIGTGLEEADVAYLRQQAGTKIVDFTGRMTLPELACLIQRSRIAIGVDSMAMHLASLTEVPQVVLFGPTNPRHWAPRHAQARVIYAGQTEPLREFQAKLPALPMEQIQVETVVRAIQELHG